MQYKLSDAMQLKDQDAEVRHIVEFESHPEDGEIIATFSTCEVGTRIAEACIALANGDAAIVTEIPPRAPLASTIRWSTDFSKPPTVTSRTAILVLRWSSEFRMDCRVYSGTEIADVFVAHARASRPLQDDGEVYEAIVPKEFAWAEVVGWPPVAHEAIAARLQAEADRFARQAEEARGMAA